MSCQHPPSYLYVSARTLVAAAVASTLAEDNCHMGLRVVVCMHCWMLQVSVAVEMRIDPGLRLRARAKRRLLLV
jgi:hypothetical protein